MNAYFYHPETKTFYKVIRLDKDKGRILLFSLEDGVEFDIEYDQEKIKKMGYKLLTEDKAKEMGLKVD